MSLTIVTGPPTQSGRTVYPVTRAEVWDHLRLTLTGSPAEPADASHVDALMATVTGYVDGKDGILNRAIITQTWDWTFDAFPGDSRHNPRASLFVPLPPLQSVTSVTYIDSAGDEQTLAASEYDVDTDSEPGRITPAYGETWPTTRDVDNAVTVRFVAGYPDDGASPPDYRANVPPALKQGMLILLAHWYEHREAVDVGNIVTDVPMTDNALLASYRVWSFW